MVDPFCFIDDVFEKYSNKINSIDSKYDRIPEKIERPTSYHSPVLHSEQSDTEMDKSKKKSKVTIRKSKPEKQEAKDLVCKLLDINTALAARLNRLNLYAQLNERTDSEAIRSKRGAHYSTRKSDRRFAGDESDEEEFLRNRPSLPAYKVLPFSNIFTAKASSFYSP